MWINTELEANKKAFKKELKFWGSIATLIVFFVLLTVSCDFKSQTESYVEQAPPLYDSVTNRQIPTEQQWWVPFSSFKTQAIHVADYPVPLEKSLGEHAWLSPVIPNTYTTGQFYLYVDFAGRQDTRLDSEYYVLPMCQNLKTQAKCFPLGENNTNGYLIANTKNNTKYQIIQENSSWFYYTYGNQGKYVIHPQENLQLLVNAEIPPHYQPSWVRISISEHPITPTKVSFLLTQHYMMWFKYLLILLPIPLMYGFHVYGGFSSYSALSFGGGLLLLMSINVMIWDINYMVIGCLCIAFSAVAYMFGHWLMLFLYLLGYLTIVQGAYQQFGEVNKDFLMKTGLLSLIGIVLLFQKIYSRP